MAQAACEPFGYTTWAWAHLYLHVKLRLIYVELVLDSFNSSLNKLDLNSTLVLSPGNGN